MTYDLFSVDYNLGSGIDEDRYAVYDLYCSSSSSSVISYSYTKLKFVLKLL